MLYTQTTLTWPHEGCALFRPPEVKSPEEWETASNHVFTSLLRELLPELPLDRELKK